MSFSFPAAGAVFLSEPASDGPFAKPQIVSKPLAAFIRACRTIPVFLDAVPAMSCLKGQRASVAHLSRLQRQCLSRNLAHGHWHLLQQGRCRRQGTVRQAAALTICASPQPSTDQTSITHFSSHEVFFGNVPHFEGIRPPGSPYVASYRFSGFTLKGSYPFGVTKRYGKFTPIEGFELPIEDSSYPGGYIFQLYEASLAKFDVPSFKMRRRAMAESHPSPVDSATRPSPMAVSSHVSTYRASQLELQLYSPSMRVGARGPTAVFNDHDQLSGRVILDFQAHHTGKLILSIEGCLLYTGQGSSPFTEPQHHVFCKVSHTIDVAPPPPAHTGFTLRDVFGMRRSSSSQLNVKAGLTERSYPFQLSLPQGSKPGEELPPSLISQTIDGNPMTATCEISYKFILTWHPNAFSETPSYLEVPIVVESDCDFQSRDAGLGASGDDWIEMPLKTERTLPMKCAIALPTSVSFCRDSSIPFFVVFSTTPRSRSLAREVASDSTISISLVRQTIIQQPQMTFPLTPPPSPIKESPTRILRRVGKSNARLKRKRSSFEEDEFRHKPLPDIPLRTCFQENKTVYSDFFLGFPKRPRHFCDPGNHPSLEAQSSLPDGLHKGKIPLHKDMLPCIDWAGVNVKYYLDISVINGIDDMRARIPIKIY